MKYNPVHAYTLTPTSESQSIEKSQGQYSNEGKSKAERLRELKKLLDENVLTADEYEKEKKKILSEDE